MPNQSVRMLRLIKQAAMEAIEAGSPANCIYGIVTQTAPLEIQLENKLRIPAEMLLLTKNTCLWSVDMTVNHRTEDAAGGSGEAEYASHHHAYKGTKTFLVHNELKAGDKVILIRCQGGQRYIVLDRVYNPERGCGG